MSSERLDLTLVERDLAPSRARAQMLIAEHVVYCNGKLAKKPSAKVAPDDILEVRGQPIPWVSRGGLKLARGLENFQYPVEGLVCLDVGASTGGFTDVLRHNGAAKIYAVDVGHDQLAEEIRNDSRVISLENTNARMLTRTHVPDDLDAVVCDASFISLQSVLQGALELVKPGAWLIALIKPQFQAGPQSVGKGGVVKDPEVRQRVCDEVKGWLLDKGWLVDGIIESPITGPEGNVEFLIGARLPEADEPEA